MDDSPYVSIPFTPCWLNLKYVHIYPLSLSLSLSLSHESKYHEYANIQIVNHFGIQKQYTCKMKRNDGINIIKMSISFIDAMLYFMPGGFAMYLWTSTFPDWLIDLDSNLPN